MAKQVTEEMIREAAYFLWEKAGRPDGSGEEFWLQAHVQLIGEEKTSAKKTCSKKSCTKAPAKKKACSKK